MKTTLAIAKGLAIGAALIAVAVLTGCTMTVSPDGTRHYSASGAEIARAIIILSDK